MCCVEIIQQDISSLSLPLSYFYDIKSTFNVDGFETVHHIFTFYRIPGGTGGQTFEKADCNTYIFHFVWCGYIETWEIHQFGNIIWEVLWISVVSYSAITWCCKREKNNILYNLCRLQKLLFFYLLFNKENKLWSCLVLFQTYHFRHTVISQSFPSLPLWANLMGNLAASCDRSEEVGCSHQCPELSAAPHCLTAQHSK